MRIAGQKQFPCLPSAGAINIQLFSPRASRGKHAAFAMLVALALSAGCTGENNSGDRNPGSTPDTAPPSISITGPAPGSSHSGTITVTASASDDVGVLGVQFRVDGANVGTEDTVAPFSYAWDTRTLTNGLHSLTAVARDAAGNTATSPAVNVTVNNSTPDTTAPSVAITAPSGGTVSGTLTVSANASDDVGVAAVQFQLDGSDLGPQDTTSPYSISWNTTGVGNGAHVLTAVARDAAGNIATSAAVNVVVNNAVSDTTAPSVSITTPNGGTVSATITVSASAADNVGVAGVQFHLDGNNLGAEDTSPPFEISWVTTGTNNGPHELAALARDVAGNAAVSTAVMVTVDNGTPAPGPAINVGQVVADPPTLETIGVSLPILSGDTNYNAQVRTFYRVSGQTTWNEALPLLRVRPEFLYEDPSIFPLGEQFAGSIFDLEPNTSYDVKLDVTDPDGGSTSQQLTIRTRALPPANPATPRAVNVSTTDGLNTALNAAEPGDVITLANGTYSGAITIARSGTEANPIFLRGQSRDGVIIDAADTGAAYGIMVSGANVVVENLTVRNSSRWGMRLEGATNVVVRRLQITDVFYGIDARGGAHRNYYICDNKLEGKRVAWPTNDNSVWYYEGIVVTGSGHVVCYNTLSGFGDALGLHDNNPYMPDNDPKYDTTIPNRAIDFYGNDVLWTGDNGVELDGTDRNVRAFRNRFTNSGNHSISFQPVWGGPAYAIRNIAYNSGSAPFKLNNDPTGFYILHNTVVRPGLAWRQLGGQAGNFQFLNNLVIGTSDAVHFTTIILSPTTIDYNGWSPDGTFTFTNTWGNFADLLQNSPYEHHGILLNGLPFATSLSIPSDYQTFVSPLDATLSPGTNALDHALRLPNINDGFTGGAPDLGAVERGLPYPSFGVRLNAP